MNRNKGFTLIELLVVMAIISILAAIAVPNIIGRIERARAVSAVSEVGNIELALTNVLTDAGVSNLGQLFNPNGVRNYIGIQPGTMLTSQAFERAKELYTRVLYAVLREGRQALVDEDLGPQGVGRFAQYLDQNVVRKLGTSYFTELAFDPWGNLYQIYPGPWPAPRRNAQGVLAGQVPFRIYDIDTSNQLPGNLGGGRRDEITLLDVIDPETGQSEVHGYAAPRDEVAFVYSFGANLLSGQAVYRQIGYDPPNRTDYYPPQEPEFMGGGDDINSWDNGASWERFYN